MNAAPSSMAGLQFWEQLFCNIVSYFDYSNISTPFDLGKGAEK